MIETEYGFVKMGDFFIDNFIKNKDLETEGELSFEMMFTGEAGLDKGIFL